MYMESNKKPTVLIIVLLIILIGLVLFKNKPAPTDTALTEETPVVTTDTEKTTAPTPVVSQPKTTTPKPATSQPVVTKSPYDLKNTWVIVDGRQVKVVNGFAVITAGDPSNNETISYAGYETVGDINGDKKADVVALYTRQNKNTKNLYYLVAGMSTPEDGYKTSNMVAIDQGITMQSVKINSNDSEILVYYLQKKQTDPASAVPSVPTTVVIKPVVGAPEIEKIK